jgi:hypothetical protein
MGLDVDTTAWSPTRRILFRFAFVYLILYLLPFPLNYFGNLFTVQPYAAIWDAVVPWVGKHVFQTEITVRPNGSGDTTYNYVQVVCFAVIAGVATVLWTLLDRRRTQYARLHRALRIYVRFGLAYFMILYGAVKVIKSQFPDPGLDRLLQPIGDTSPMGLLWTFMGASTGYNIFAGGGELLGGLLLTMRHTTILGALVSIGVLANVFVLNMCYDVPVKLFSVHLLAMAVFIALPDLRRIADFFVFNRALAAVEYPPLLGRKWLDRGVCVVRTILVLIVVGLSLYVADQGRKQFAKRAEQSPLYGIWNVEDFELDGKSHPALVTDTGRWRRVIFDYPGVLALQLMSDSRERYLLKLDPDTKAMSLSRRDNPEWKSELQCKEGEPGVLTLEGKFDGRTLRAKLRRADAATFQLTSRGFHWINEYPFNR